MRRLTEILFLAFLLVVPAKAQPNAIAGHVPAFPARAYGTSPAQRMDIYLPDSGARAHHAVLVLQGVGFRTGSRHMANPALVRALLARGYAVVTVDYRLSAEAPFPAAVQDVFAAIAHLRANAETLKLTGKLAVYGESAGANLATLAGTAFGDPVFRQDIPDKQASVRPDGVVALYPPVDFAQVDPMLRAQGCPAAQNSHDQYFGAVVASAPEKVARANPITYLSGSIPAFFIQNGDRDCSVGAGQGRLLAQALEKWGLRVTYQALPGAGHGGPAFETTENIERIIAFLDAH